MKYIQNYISITLFIVFINIYMTNAQDTIKRNIEFTILSATITEQAQPFITGITINEGEEGWNIATLKATECDPPGIAFGIIEYKIKNNSNLVIHLLYDSICLKVNGIKKNISGEMPIDPIKSAFGFSSGYSIKEGNERKDKIIFTSTTKLLKEVTLEYKNENLIPITHVKFKTK